MGHRIEWNGQNWWRNRNGYYQNRRGQLLHRAKWSARSGRPVPAGLDVHHIDGDPGNNADENLELLSRRDHLAKHGPRGFVALSTAERSTRAKAEWRRREPTDRKCAHCGAAFRSTGARAKFCRPACKQADIRGRSDLCRSVVCASCGVGFQSSIYKSTRYCSAACFQRSRRKPARQCIVCGADFRANDPRTPTCSRACGYRYRSRQAA